MMKRCLDCGQDQPLDLFNKDKSRPDGLAAYCRPCFKVRRDTWYYANKRAVRLQQSVEGFRFRPRVQSVKCIPPWFERDKVRKVYDRAMDMGLTVDHIVPLKSEKVCGLHCWANLQLLTKSENSRKFNRDWPDSP